MGYPWEDRRRVTARTPRGPARCINCGAELHYDYGSIAWRCQTEDKCPECQGKEAAERIVEKFARDLAKIR